MELYRAKALEPYDDPHHEVNGYKVWVVDVEKARELGFEIVVE